jgi:hypothetical protein
MRRSLNLIILAIPAVTSRHQRYPVSSLGNRNEFVTRKLSIRGGITTSEARTDAARKALGSFDTIFGTSSASPDFIETRASCSYPITLVVRLALRIVVACSGFGALITMFSSSATPDKKLMLGSALNTHFQVHVALVRFLDHFEGAALGVSAVFALVAEFALNIITSKFAKIQSHLESISAPIEKVLLQFKFIYVDFPHRP